MLGDKEEAIEEEERSTNESSLSLDEEEEEEEDRCLFFCCCCFCFLRALIVLCTAVNSLNFCKVKAQTPRAKERPATDGAPLPTESSAFTLADGCNRDACQLGIHKQWKERGVSLYSFVFVPNGECLKKRLRKPKVLALPCTHPIQSFQRTYCFGSGIPKSFLQDH